MGVKRYDFNLNRFVTIHSFYGGRKMSWYSLVKGAFYYILVMLIAQFFYLSHVRSLPYI